MELPHREKEPEAMLRRQGERGVHLLLGGFALSTREMKCRREAARVREREGVIDRTSEREPFLHPRGRPVGISEHPERPGQVRRARQAWIQATAIHERTVGTVFARMVPLDSLLQMCARGLESALVER